MPCAGCTPPRPHGRGRSDPASCRAGRGAGRSWIRQESSTEDRLPLEPFYSTGRPILVHLVLLLGRRAAGRDPVPGAAVVAVARRTLNVDAPLRRESCLELERALVAVRGGPVEPFALGER